MRICFVILFLVLLSSCLQEEIPSSNKEIKTNPTYAKDQFVNDDLWICYHPDTKFHDKVCVEKYFPDGCYIKGDNTKFCWRLTYEDCIESTPEHSWFNHCTNIIK